MAAPQLAPNFYFDIPFIPALPGFFIVLLIHYSIFIVFALL